MLGIIVWDAMAILEIQLMDECQRVWYNMNT